MTSDHELADELIRIAALIRLRQDGIHPRTRFLLHATVADANDLRRSKRHAEPGSMVCEEYPNRMPVAKFIDFRPNQNDLARRQRASWHQSSHSGPPKAWRPRERIDPQYDLTLRIHEQSDIAFDSIYFFP